MAYLQTSSFDGTAVKMGLSMQFEGVTP